MSNPVKIIVGEGGSAEINVPGYGIIAGRDGPPGPAGDDGKSAYQIAVDNGFVGTEEEWLASLVGPQGEPGADGTVSFDELTPEQQESLRGDTGPAGQDGVSPTVAFTAITGGNRMTVTDKDHPSGQSINIMDGTQGATGPAGPGVPSGGDAGQILVKKNSTDYDGEWRNPLDGIQAESVAGKDLDTYTTGGHWYFPNNYPPTNKPADSGNYGFLLVLKSSSISRITQIWIDNVNNVVYTRKNSNNTTISWSDWRRITPYLMVEGTATPASPLPTGVSFVQINYVQNGPVVQVYYAITRTSGSISSWVTVATGLPAPAYVYSFPSGSSNITLPIATGFVAGIQSARPMLLYVGKADSTRGHLRMRYGETEGIYAGSFTYITDEM